MTDIPDLIKRLRQSATMLADASNDPEPNIGFWHSEVAEKAAGALRDMSRGIDGMVDDVMHLEAEIERLREALQIMVNQEVDYMTRNKLGDPEHQHGIRVSRRALGQPVKDD